MNPPADQGQTLPAGDWLAPLDEHRVWWSEGGDPHGLPVLLVHGGPGGASRIEPTRWFDGLPVRWIAIDQRGCGRSTPLGGLHANTMTHLMADIERLRRHLGLERWSLAGGSWGARLALAWVADRPQHVHGLLLRSPFLGSLAETRRYIAPWSDWLGQAGRAWLGEGVAEAIEAYYREQPGLFRNGTGSNISSMQAARAWAAFDDLQSAPGGAVAAQARGAGRFDVSRLPEAGATLAASWALHCHYAERGWGAADGWPVGLPPASLAAAPGPVRVVWGEADATCDPAVARALAAALPGARAMPVAAAGHRMSQPELAAALRESAQAWVADLLR